MKIYVKDESETYEAAIYSVVKAGVLHYRISFLTAEEPISKADAEECRLVDETIQDGYDD